MTVVGVHEAKTHFSKLLARAEAGEEILIARSGKPVARLAPLMGLEGIRNVGIDRGRFEIPPDFDMELSEDLLVEFER